MGQFKPMVKMETTEPSVELKLKKGGKVAKMVKKADGGMMGSPMSAPDIPPAMPARGGMPMAGAPMRPSLAMRRRAMKGMPAGAGPAGPIGGASQMQPSMPAPMPAGMPAMKKGGKAEGGKMDMAQDKAMIKKAFKQHDMQEHKGGKGTALKLKHGGKMATGGVVNGQGGYAKGGIINTEGQGGEYRNTKMDTAKSDHSPAKTGGVKMGNGGGYATGGVAKSNGGGYKKGGKVKGMMDGGMAGNGMMGGGMMDDGMYPAAAYKKGGATKKHYATGGSVNSTGSAVAMPQGRKPASKPVAINELAGTYKRGGRVAPGNRALQAVSQKENATAMRQAKAMTNEKYGPASKMKLAEGGDVDLSKGAYDKSIGPDADDLEMARSIRGFPGKMFGKVKGLAKDLFSTMPKSDSVTKTKESVTVTPGKKRGGSVKC
jgi:hypothetical protein